jgi:hypothetical protein
MNEMVSIVYIIISRVCTYYNIYLFSLQWEKDVCTQNVDSLTRVLLPTTARVRDMWLYVFFFFLGGGNPIYRAKVTTYVTRTIGRLVLST